MMKNKRIISAIIIVSIIFIIGIFTIVSIMAYDVHKKESKSSGDVIREASKLERDSLIKNIEDVYNYYLASYYPILDVSKLSNQQILKFGEDMSGVSSSAKDFDSAIKKYLYNVNYHHEDLQCFCGTPIYLYDNTLKSYVYNENHYGHGGGGLLRAGSKAFYVSSQITNEKEIEFKVKILYERLCGDVCLPYMNAYYGSLNDSYNRTNPLIGSPDLEEDVTVTSEDYSRIKDNIITTTFKFIIDGDNYLLKSVVFE